MQNNLIEKNDGKATDGNVEKIERINFLAKQIERYQKSYYQHEAEISDAEFDALWDELKALSPEHPLLARVGSDLFDDESTSGTFKKARHIMPMGSQEKAANEEQFLAWASKHVYDEYLVEYKLDGASLEMQYEDGKFVRAVTRGDGVIGDDITSNVVKMKSFVAKVDDNFTGGVRGEVIMEHDVFEKHFANKANCRNAANGLMKRKDGDGAEHLRIICYDALSTKEISPFETEKQKIDWLNSQKFCVVPLVVCKNAQQVIDLRKKINDERKNLSYDIDGLVIKNNEIDKIDASRTRPDKQIAFKFPLEEAVTIVRKVVWNENGATYTPVAEFDTVQLAGTKVSNASLANPVKINELGLFIGSRVVVTKRGEIIPKIEKVLPPLQDESIEENEEKDDAQNCNVDDLPLFESANNCKQNVKSALEPVQVPTVCASCGTTLVNDLTRLYCPNKACKKRVHHQLEKWIQVLDIRDFGEALLKSLFNDKKVTCISDIYRLTENILAPYFLKEESLEKEKISLGAKKVYNAIMQKRTVPLSLFVAGFDIESMGVTMIEKLIQSGFNTLDSLLNASVEEIANVPMFAEISAKNLVQGLSENAKEMRELVASGTIIIEEKSSGALSGKSFCFTGELVTMKRSMAEKLVKDAGGTCKSSVTKDLTYLVTNDTESGSSKNQKAKSYGIAIINEDAFLRLLKDSGVSASLTSADNLGAQNGTNVAGASADNLGAQNGASTDASVQNASTQSASAPAMDLFA